MGMVVRSNIMAVNSQRQLNMNNSQVSKSLEKLSSGYRINRAGDDASGLAISEKMKSQIKGLDTASLNAQDGISLVQTAEGALTEVHNMLNRMTELATRAANGINDDINRESLQKEVKDLKSEIDRIADSTDFNGLKLLNGEMGVSDYTAKVLNSGKLTAVNLTLDFKTMMGARNLTNFEDGASITFTDASGTAQTFKFVNVTSAAPGTGMNEVVLGTTLSASISALMTKMNSVLGTTISLASGVAGISQVVVTAAPSGSGDIMIQFKVTGAVGSAITGLDDDSQALLQDIKMTGTSGMGLKLQIGATADDYNQMAVSIGDMGTKGIGIDGLDISSQKGAAEAIDTINAAIDKVSAQRATMGAIQNRLEYTINNLDTASENLQSANSRIRDTDMAKMMMEYTKMNVLTQSAQAMLAQANQQPQSVLQLLQ